MAEPSSGDSPSPPPPKSLFTQCTDIMQMKNGPDYPLRVPSNPGNPFNYSYNVGLGLGLPIGLTLGYFFGGFVLPRVRSLCSAVYLGHCKMSLVVNDGLRMSKGKVASQCAHGSHMAFEYASSPLRPHHRGWGAIWGWRLNGMEKVVLRVPNEAAMAKLDAECKALKLNTVKVYDAGRTEIAANSWTVLVIGPGPCLNVDAVTAHLRLL